MICRRQAPDDSGIGYNEKYTQFITALFLKIVFPFLLQPFFISVSHLSTPTVKLFGTFILQIFSILSLFISTSVSFPFLSLSIYIVRFQLFLSALYMHFQKCCALSMSFFLLVHNLLRTEFTLPHFLQTLSEHWG